MGFIVGNLDLMKPFFVGGNVGNPLGINKGCTDGIYEGFPFGWLVGNAIGCMDGPTEGWPLGNANGIDEGLFDGDTDGIVKG